MPPRQSYSGGFRSARPRPGGSSASFPALTSRLPFPSSFVRQLNFYGFRKVKFSDSLRIDRAKEAKTAKYWRFRHDSFRRGRKDLLPEIKRNPSSSAAAHAARAAATKPPADAAAPPVAPAKGGAPAGEVAGLRTEVRELRQKIASMSVNMDELTDMVKKVAVGDDDEEVRKGGGVSPVVSSGNLAKLAESEAARPGNKRKKMDGQTATKQQDADGLSLISDWQSSSADALPDWHMSSSDLAEMTPLAKVAPLPLGSGPHLPELVASAPLPAVASSPPPSDEEFVDDLFMAFAEDRDIFTGIEGDLERINDSTAHRDGPAQSDAEYGKTNDNKPCPQVMQRIEASLSTLPRDMHEMVANRLIDAISETRPIAESAGALFPTPTPARAASPLTIPQDVASAVTPRSVDKEVRDGGLAAPSLPLPVAVAALKTILSEYGVALECKGVTRAQKEFAKSLPVVPVHA